MKIVYRCITDAGNLLILIILVVVVRVVTTLVRPLLRVGIDATEPVLYLSNIRVSLVVQIITIIIIIRPSIFIRQSYRGESNQNYEFGC